MTTEYSLPRLVNKVYLLKSEERHERLNLYLINGCTDYSISVSATFITMYFHRKGWIPCDQDSVTLLPIASLTVQPLWAAWLTGQEDGVVS